MSIVGQLRSPRPVTVVVLGERRLGEDERERRLIAAGERARVEAVEIAGPLPGRRPSRASSGHGGRTGWRSPADRPTVLRAAPLPRKVPNASGCPTTTCSRALVAIVLTRRSLSVVPRLSSAASAACVRRRDEVLAHEQERRSQHAAGARSDGDVRRRLFERLRADLGRSRLVALEQQQPPERGQPFRAMTATGRVGDGIPRAAGGRAPCRRPKAEETGGHRAPLTVVRVHLWRQPDRLLHQIGGGRRRTASAGVVGSAIELVGDGLILARSRRARGDGRAARHRSTRSAKRACSARRAARPCSS